MYSSYYRFWRPLPPPPHKISNNILIYLTSYRILAPPSLSLRLLSIGIWGGAKILQKVMAPPLSVIKIVKYCGVGGGGGGIGGAKILQKVMPAPLSVSKIVKYWGGGGGRQNPTKDMAPPLSVIKLVRYYGVRGGGGALGGRQSPT